MNKSGINFTMKMTSCTQHNLGRSGLILAILLHLTWAASAEVKVLVDHNTGNAATAAFKFKNVPSPRKDDAAAKAKMRLIVGEANPSSGGLAALTDGLLPEEEDQPNANFIFGSGSDGGRILMDLGSAIEIAQVNTYSWHSDTR